MAIPVTNIPVLTGEVAERFIEQCEYNAKHLAGSEWSQEREDRFNRIMERSLELQRKLGGRGHLLEFYQRNGLHLFFSSLEQEMRHRNWDVEKDGPLKPVGCSATGFC